MNKITNIYNKLGKKILNNGMTQVNKKGTSKFLLNEQIKFYASDSPFLHNKYINFENIKHELIWFLKGSEKINYLHKNKIYYWDKFINEEKIEITNSYPRYFKTKKWKHILESIQSHTPSRNLNLTLHDNDMKYSSQSPCISEIIFNINNNELHMTVNQRSADFCLGLPYDLIIMSLMLNMLCEQYNYDNDWSTITFNLTNIHIYENHISQILKQISKNFDIQHNFGNIMFKQNNNNNNNLKLIKNAYIIGKEELEKLPKYLYKLNY